MNHAKPFKVVLVPTALAAMGKIDQKLRIIGEYKTLEDAQEAAYLENVDEPAPDKEEFRHFEIIEFRGWDKPYKIHK